MPATRRIRHTATNSIMFDSRKAETDKMLELRELGYSNKQIGEKIGVSQQTVHARIGDQPATLTLSNRRLARKVHSAKVRIRKHEAQLQAARRYNELATEINNHIIAISEAKKKMLYVKPTAVKNVPTIPMMPMIPVSAVAN